jgi:eukaryotic-like serine/threonine-protein kinase
LLPLLTEEQVTDSFPQITAASKIGQGGQKVVFRVRVGEQDFVLKFLSMPDEPGEGDFTQTNYGRRAIREVETLRECRSPHMVKPGPLGLELVTIAGENLLSFSEEFIAGSDLSKLLADDGPLDYRDVVRLGLDMADVIGSLWELGLIHRDIKPQNIMRGAAHRGFVLLDAGLAFDPTGESLSAGFVVGTKIYFSPEQWEYGSRRSIDPRSDMFALGVTMYQMLTGIHPFYKAGQDMRGLMDSILKLQPPVPSLARPGIPSGLDLIIMKLLKKSPHERFRNTGLLKRSLLNLGDI